MSRRAGLTGLVLGAIFFPAGAALLGTAVWDFVAARVFASHAVRARGVVTRVEPASRFNDVEHVAFEAADGKLYQFRSNPARLPSKVGSEVPVLYDPANPADARVDRYEEMYHDIVLRAAMGTVLGIFGAGLLAGWLRARRAPARG
jgi:hypothetical protein